MKYLKKFNESNSYYEDDMNVHITSTVIDILQDLVDDGLNIECFTDGYMNSMFKSSDYHYQDNDISLFISLDDNSRLNLRQCLNWGELMPYLKRVINYIESEGRRVFIELYWDDLKTRGQSWCQIEYRYRNGEVSSELESLPDRNYNTIIMRFKN